MALALVQSFLKYAGIGKEPPAAKRAPEDSGVERPGELGRVEETSAAMCDIKAANIQMAIAAADSGEVIDQAAISASILDSRDLKVMAHWQTRRNAVIGCDWDVTAIDSANDEKAMELRKAFDTAGIKNLISTLCDADYYGYAGSFTEWDKDGAPRKFIPIHSTRFQFDLGGFPAVSQSGDGSYSPIAEMEPGRVVFSAAGDLPQKSGLCRGIMWVWLFKRDCMLHRARHMDRFGSPIIKAKVTEAQWKDKTALNTLLVRLRESVARGVAIYPEGAELDMTAVGGSSQDDFSKFIADLDDMITTAILGQTATSSQGGGLSGNQAQENVRGDILASMCRRIMDSIKRQLLNHAARFMFGEQYADAFEFKIDYEPTEDMAGKANIVKILSDAGYPADDDWVSETFGIPLKEKPEPPPPPAFPPQFQQKQLAMSDDAMAENETASRITEEALRRMLVATDAIDAMRKPLRDAIAEVFDGISMDDDELPAKFAAKTDEFFKRFPSLYRAMGASSDKFEDVFRGAILTAVAKA